ncbi:hypothetical protein CN187_23460 [Sinorhizobium meliloti]|uniref:hypothetical protein n=1 Tax=Rhizobium meliloti TaxID=382 RepID=UPI000FD99ABC|nr:hypothetical protein [Sinorhizobium meliloti]RVI64089.1 hypothetical protein CN187_23460 [Sinorhizobium meliloti]
MSYGTSPHDYVSRAERCLQQNDPRYLFYAAFELRCAVEARMQQYLESWEHVSKKQKEGWEIKKLGSATERAFKTGDRVMRWRIDDEHETLAVLYYTPVTRKLRSNAERLGDYLHAPKKHHSEGDVWWSEFRALLEEMISQLRIATTGTLMGPALVKGNKIHMSTEVPPGTNLDQIYRHGATMTVHVDYLEELPATLETEAVVWK